MSENITDRLRCRYAMGPIMPNGEPEFGWRDFSGPGLEGMTLPTPLMLEAAEAITAKDAEIKTLREALQFYADQDHFIIADEDAWDAVSGEPQNYFCDEAGTATVEDGSIARAALAQEQS